MPRITGEAEGMNCTGKWVSIRVFHYPDLAALEAHVLAFVTADNLAKHHEALRWRVPFQANCNAWTRARATGTTARFSEPQQ